MQSPSSEASDIGKVPKNLHIENKNIPSEHPSTSVSTDIRMNMKLPECHVLVTRLTNEEIQHVLIYERVSEISDDVRSKTEELLRQTEEAVNNTDTFENALITDRKDGTKRRMRVSSKSNNALFEIYKRKRQGFMNRRNRTCHSENSLDWSQDEFEAESDSGRSKKKLKRGRKYEYDFDWSPSMLKNTAQSTRKLRRHVRRPVIESDSSTSDDDILNFLANDDYSDKTSTEPAFQSIVPSGSDTYEHVDTSTYNFSGKYAAIRENQNSSQTSSINSNSNLHSSDSMSGDIVSDIIKNMNKLQNKNLKTSFTQTVQSSVSNNVKIKPIQSGRKRLISSCKNKVDNVDADVAVLLIDIIKTVSTQVKQQDGSKKKFSKVCKWCSTPFATNRETELMCAICCDLGKSKYHQTNSTNKKLMKPLNSKRPKEKKSIQRKNNTMSRVLKNLPKPDMQRIMYTEKTDKMSFEKGYNHCKSFITPRDSKDNTDIYTNSFDCNNVLSNKISIKLNENGNLIESKKEAKNCPTFSRQSLSDKSSIHLTQNKAIDIAKKNVQKGESSYILKSVDGALFHMTFPDSHEKHNMQNKLQMEHNSKKLSGLNDGKTGNKSVSPSNSNALKSLVCAKQHDTYLFPPIPTVIVSNYCNDTSGLNLSHTYFQNEITHKHALKTSTSQSRGKADSSITASNVKSLVNITNTVSYQNSCLPTPNLLPQNTALTITTIPITNSINHIMPFASSNTSPVLNSLIPAAPNKVTLMPIVSSVISLSDKNMTHSNIVNESVEKNSDLFSLDNFVNSQNLEIKITHVSSEKTYEKSNSVTLNSETVLGSSKNNDQNTEVQKEIEIPQTIALQRLSTDSVSNSSEFMHTTEMQKEISIHTSDAEHDVEIPVISEICISNAESESNENIVDTENSSNLTSNSTDVQSSSKTDLNTDEQAEQLPNHSIKQSVKCAENKENAISSAMDVLGAVSILAVIDLEKHPQSGLNVRIQVTKSQLLRLTSEKNITPELNEKISSCQYNLQVLNIASKYLNLYGSFAKVSDFLLRKAKMVQIKKELFLEDSNQSSCMYSQSNNSLPNNVSRPEVTFSPATSINSCGINGQATSINHIQKMQSQIAAMNNTQVPHYDTGSTIHHFPMEQIVALSPAVAAPTPVTPRNDCMGGESRETPSRGSGPRTPARPESAASQSEEQSSLLLKKELMEAANSPSSQCAYSQNATLSQISSHLTVMPEISLNMPENSISNTAIQHIPVSNTNHQLFTNQTNLHLQSVEMPPNRTISYNNNQNYSDVLLSMATKHQVNPTASSPEVRQNRQVLLGQQMYVQNTSGMCGKQPVPSVNNQFVIRQPFPSNTTGTVLLNNSQVGQNALLTNVSNQQFYTSNQIYYPSSQITCVPSDISSPDIATSQNQQSEVPPDQMVCAVCKSQATLRCKQCARVAYCNTTCAKTYWHQKHKMECKPLPS